MTLPVYQFHVTNLRGRVMPGASVDIAIESPGLPPATVYADRDGSTLIGSTVVADSSGYVKFYTAAGYYRITATLGSDVREWTDVAISPIVGADILAGIVGAHAYYTGLNEIGPSPLLQENANGIGIGVSPSYKFDILGGDANNARVRNTLGTQSAAHAAGYTIYDYFNRYGTSAVLMGFGNTHASRPSFFQLGAFNSEQGIAIVTDESAAILAGTSVKGIIVAPGGNIGLGIATAAVPVHAQGAVRIIADGSAQNIDLVGRASDNASLIRFIDNAFTVAYGSLLGESSGITFSADGARILKFLTNSAERMRLDTSGNLGINVTSMDALLHVKRTTDAMGVHFHQEKNNGGSENFVYINDDRGFGGANTGNTLLVRSWASGGEDTGNLAYFSNFSGSDNPALVVKLIGGKVGIGTATVGGASTHIKRTGSGSGQTPDANATLVVESDTTNLLQLLAPNATVQGITLGNVTDALDAGIYLSLDASRMLSFRAGGNVTRMAIDSSGDVAIGSTATGNGTLAIVGPSYPYTRAVSHQQGTLRLATGGANTADALFFGVHDTDYAWMQAVKPGTGYRDLLLQGEGGLVGVGGVPTAKLDVQHAGNHTIRMKTSSGFAGLDIDGNSTSYIFFKTGGTETARLEAVSDVMIWYLGSGAAEKMRLTGGGLGVGTQPSQRFHAGQPSSTGANYFLASQTAADTTGALFGIDGSSNALVYNQLNGNMIFATNNIERMRLSPSGKLSIGTATASTISGQGFKEVPYSLGTGSGGGTVTPDAANGNEQYIVSGGNWTLAAPSDPSTIGLEITNNGTAGVITESGFDEINGDAFDATNGHTWYCVIKRTQNKKILTKMALF